MRGLATIIVIVFLFTGCVDRTAATANSSFSVLVFSKTAAFRHASIPTATALIQKLGQENGFQVETTEDAAVFTPQNLSRYQVVIFALTTGDVLNDTQQTAFEGFIRSGGGYAGIHSASDTEYSWPWYGRLVGAYFKNHPPGLQGSFLRSESNHPSMQLVPSSGWRFSDEIYNFRTNPRGQFRILANVDESTYQGGSMGDHPISWCHEFEGGRSWYTGLGHSEALYTDPVFQQIILGGILYAAQRTDFKCNQSQ